MFSWGDFGDFSDRFTDIRTGVNSLVSFWGLGFRVWVAGSCMCED